MREVKREAAYLLREGHEVRIEDYIVNRYSPERARAAIGSFAPDVIAIPCLTCAPTDEVKAIYDAFLEVSREYASRMNWRSH